METQVNDTNKRLSFGVVLVAVGTLFVLKTLNILPDYIEDFFFQWQMILIVIGIFNLINRQYGPAIVSLAVGIFFLVSEYYIIPELFRKLIWPFALIILGLVIIFKKKSPYSSNFAYDKNIKSSQDYIDQVNVFGGNEVNFNSKSFKGGRIINVFGGSEVNFYGAEMEREHAVIQNTTVFGGNEITVPHHWDVKIEIISIFGGVSDKRMHKNTNESNKLLVLKGFTMFGGLEIKN